eukprot:gene13222-biopygen8634
MFRAQSRTATHPRSPGQFFAHAAIVSRSPPGLISAHQSPAHDQPASAYPEQSYAGRYASQQSPTKCVGHEVGGCDGLPVVGQPVGLGIGQAVGDRVGHAVGGAVRCLH